MQQHEIQVEAPDADERFALALTEAQPVLRGYLRNMLPNPADVDDVLQETNHVLWRKRHDFDPARSFRPWACRFGYFQALDFLKRRNRREDHPFSPELMNAIAEETERRTDKFEARVSALRHCVDQLKSDHRDLVKRRYENGESVTALAELSGKTADAVSMTLHRIRKILEKCITRATSSGA